MGRLSHPPRLKGKVQRRPLGHSPKGRGLSRGRADQWGRAEWAAELDQAAACAGSSPWGRSSGPCGPTNRRWRLA